MKVVILAGGFGTRISEESHLKPKPMIEIGDAPILWHIMKSYSYYGYDEFIICCGYKGYKIKEYFADYYLHRSDITFDFKNNNEMIVNSNVAEPWKVTLVDTGLKTETGGRLQRVQKYVGEETFMLTYGDGVSDINISELVDFHKASRKIATMTAIQPGGRFGVLEIDDSQAITNFAEKNKEDGGWINAGYMVMEPQIFDYLEGDSSVLERDPLENLARDNELMAYKYQGFWQCMDTLRDKIHLDMLVEKGTAPWIKW
ncbi:Glucose-1-phosphate cytidylyltransferase [Dehalobacter sp. UNSWDHB]|jgi:glucose-1-phosphate cytidylyltransferase|uniref:glucose-1-phosphate cytidylyltransferase n=1 Tax=unclassified Dehalobacter TaxID=2635733 RepID=UPI00028AC576|nr:MULTISPECIES: glucose-1-phosphate cytidylyltransferase [unclassified Dehalobacter]AFV02592.1 Glucose-1-phosphate cytidylyltransferase [Dehalobacter sp. DCA]AFV05578.1 Glucose-1-phosphate cytidylyltransferase [Dehalobacter sp. CF]EQB21729.1 Glucose-1-phosphate cytidylyltransferase [Dehalobacter sp. UNSWDHB]